MSVLIPNMIMPEHCGECRFAVDVWCYAYGKPNIDALANDGRTNFCPLIKVPPHGRLIDADALMHEFEKAQRTMAQHGREYSCSFMSSSQELSTEWYCVEDMLENAPTILEEEGIPPTEYEEKPKPTTNADRIRAMTDEELAEFMWAGCDNITQEACKRHAGCVDCWLDWLRQEVAE